MICQRMMVRGVKTVPFIWEFTINTEASTQGEKKTGIPFNLYGQDDVALSVDWGDGQSITLTSSDYAAADAMASTHEYQNAGIYQIKISSKNWNKSKIGYTLTATDALTSNNQLCLKYFKKTLVSLDSPLPETYGSEELSGSGRTERQGNCYGVFFRCIFLSSVPPKFLSEHTNGLIRSYYYTFGACPLLTSAPRDLLYYNPYTVAVNSMLLSNIGDIELDILSPDINSISGFLSNSTSYSRIIHVKANSTTEATFLNNTSMGLTVIADL